MMSKGDDTAKKVCGAMLAEHAKRPEYFPSGEVHKYRLKDTVWVTRHYKDVMSRHRQQSWYIPRVILRKTGQDGYVIQVGNNKTVERDHTQLLPRELDPHGRAVTFEFTADAFDSDNDEEEDEYTAERILSDKPDPSTPGGRLYKVRWKGFVHQGNPWNLQAALCRGTRPFGWTTSKLRKSSWMSKMCWFTWSWAPQVEALLTHIFVHPHLCISFLCRSDAYAKARNLPSTPRPDFIDMRRAFRTKISLRLCSYFVVCTIAHRLLRGLPRNHGCLEPLIIPHFFGWSLW